MSRNSCSSRAGEKRNRNWISESSHTAENVGNDLAELDVSNELAAPNPSRGKTKKARQDLLATQLQCFSCSGNGQTEETPQSGAEAEHFCSSSYARLHLRPNCRVFSHHSSGPPLWIELSTNFVQLGRTRSLLDATSMRRSVLTVAPLDPLVISRKHVLLRHICEKSPPELARTASCGGGWQVLDGDGIASSSSGFAIDDIHYGGNPKSRDPASTAPATTTPAVTSKWLRNGSIIRIGPALDPPQLEYIFVAPPVATCPNRIENCSTLESLATVDLKNASCLPPAVKSESSQSHGNHSSRSNSRQGESLKCIICSELLMLPTSLGCGHIFCKPCIEKWFCSKKFWCPMCRKPLLHLPSRLFGLDSMIEDLSCTSNETDLESRRKEFEADLNCRTADLERLKAKVVTFKAKTTDSSFFLDIRNKWTIVQRRKFADQIQRYPYGPPREYFCSLVGLTTDFATNCTPEVLFQAMENLFLQPGWRGENGSSLIPSSRLRLQLFMTYG